MRIKRTFSVKPEINEKLIEIEQSTGLKQSMIIEKGILLFEKSITPNNATTKGK